MCVTEILRTFHCDLILLSVIGSEQQLHRFLSCCAGNNSFLFVTHAAWLHINKVPLLVVDSCRGQVSGAGDKRWGRRGSAGRVLLERASGQVWKCEGDYY